MSAQTHSAKGKEVQESKMIEKVEEHDRDIYNIGTFTVQCSDCYKWRLIPTKEKYEKYVQISRWRPDISCDDPADINQDGSKLWALDKPNIPQPPPCWQRLYRVRGEGCTRFADVYYVTPSGKRLRSMVEIQKYILEHPDAGLTTSQFSFQIPKPLQENYVRKRSRTETPSPGLSLPQPLEPTEVNPLAWAGPANGSQLQVSDRGELCNSNDDGHVSRSTPSPAQSTPSPPGKRRGTKSLARLSSVDQPPVQSIK
ncbi:hypothetical protein MKW94_006299 [Papaver nudicaule]|uniref:Methyl-CpG-binding domain-containing protein 2-like n=1 Tax=Papaver nudicaule TaxID=74823 RepID=A0AA41VFF2_PAPNU|nr:hypothetical protein [Papaver nudicaule]